MATEQSSITSERVEQQLQSWAQAYASVGIIIDPAKVIILPHQVDFDRLIVVPQGMTARQAFELCGQVMPVNRCDEDLSLDELDMNSPRTAQNEAYAVWYRDIIEDENHECKIDDQLKFTLTERLLIAWKYFLETGKLLYRSTITSSPRTRWARGEFFLVSCWDASSERGGVLYISHSDANEYFFDTLPSDLRSPRSA